MIKNLYLCRHGETEWSLSGQHTGRTDLPLIEEGRTQALALKKGLGKLSFDLVITSPLKRAVETCLLAGFPDPLEEPNAQEWDYGEFEGLTREEIAEKHPNWNLFLDGAPGGESVAAIGARADRFLKSIAKLEGSLLLFSHGHFLRVLAARWVGLEVAAAQSFNLSVASISRLDFEHERPVISLWNQTF
jgi:probable phosphoglycerate mutase